MRKLILTEDENISNLNFKINENEYDLFKLDNEQSNPRAKELKDSIQKLNKELDLANTRLADRYKTQDALIKGRLEIQKKIASLSKDTLGKNLIVSYKYYESLLENMTLEERKNANSNNIRIKDIQIDKLTSQIHVRDQLIHQATEELKKKNERLKVNENILKVDEIKSNAYKILPLLTNHHKPQSSHNQHQQGHNHNNSYGDLNSSKKQKGVNVSFEGPANHYKKIQNSNFNAQRNPSSHHNNKQNNNPVTTLSNNKSYITL